MVSGTWIVKSPGKPLLTNWAHWMTVFQLALAQQLGVPALNVTVSVAVGTCFGLQLLKSPQSLLALPTHVKLAGASRSSSGSRLGLALAVDRRTA